MKNLAWLQVIAGMWLILAPFALGLGSNKLATWTLVGTGLVVGIVGIIFVAGQRKPENDRKPEKL